VKSSSKKIDKYAISKQFLAKDRKLKIKEKYISILKLNVFNIL